MLRVDFLRKILNITKDLLNKVGKNDHKRAVELTDSIIQLEKEIKEEEDLAKYLEGLKIELEELENMDTKLLSDEGKFVRDYRINDIKEYIKSEEKRKRVDVNIIHL